MVGCSRQGKARQGKATTPTADDLFEVGDSCDLPTPEKARFHSGVAKLPYLAKRLRPKSFTEISYLTSRVQNPMKMI
jgi:hypothetical protein